MDGDEEQEGYGQGGCCEGVRSRDPRVVELQLTDPGRVGGRSAKFPHLGGGRLWCKEIGRQFSVAQEREGAAGGKECVDA